MNSTLSPFYRPSGPSHLERLVPLSLRISLAIVFVWFGLLKVFSMCPVEDVVRRTLFFFPSSVVYVTGVGETVIGLCLLIPRAAKIAAMLVLLHLLGTVLPLLVLPEECFTMVPWGLTLLGQYIVKNFVLCSAALTITVWPSAVWQPSEVSK